MDKEVFSHQALQLPGDMQLVYPAISKRYFYFRMHITKYIIEQHKVPLNPYMLFDYFLLDCIDRDLIRRANNSLVLRSDQIWVFGSISNGVLSEIILAKNSGKKVSYFSIGDLLEITPVTYDLVELEDEVKQFKGLLPAS